MDFERLERAWRSNANSPSEAATAYLMEETMDTLKRRRRDFQAFTTFIGLLLAAWTAKIVFDVVTDPFPFDLSREWSALPLAALPWGAFLVMRAQHARHLRAHPDPYASMPATLRALLDENAAAQRRTRWMGCLMLVFVALIALALRQLVDVGKMTPENVFQGSLMFGGMMTVVWGVVTVEYFRKLRPEGVRLARLLQQYEEAEPA